MVNIDKKFHVYVMASKRYGTLYTGVTSDLLQRVYQHKGGLADGFTKKYNVKQLVYYEPHENAEAAIMREKQIKDWQRQWKIDLIEKSNPDWRDLFENLRNRARL